MASPTNVKTWQHSHNNTQVALGSAALTTNTVMLGIKNALKAFGTLPWTVVSSSNGTTANSSDNWSTVSDMVNNTAGNAHSWIVLKQSGIASNFQLLIAMDSVTAANCSILFSPSVGFTGGTTTANPTASDSVTVISGATWGGRVTTAVQHIFNVSQSTDGQCTRVWINHDSVCTGFWTIEKPQNPSSGWTNPVIAMVTANSATTQQATIANLTGANFKGYGASAMTCSGSVEGCNTNNIHSLLTVANDLSTLHYLSQVGIYCTASPNRGRHGLLNDIWACSTSVAQADTFPSDVNNRQWAVVGTGIVVPWGLVSTAPAIV